MILVTGGTGLLGAHLLIALLKKNTEPIRATTRNIRSAEKLKVVAKFYADVSPAELSRVQWVEADVTDLLSLEDAFDGIDTVYHCAAAVSFNPKMRASIMETNIEGTANVVNLALKYSVQKFCHVSSIAAIGGDEKIEVSSETDDWDVGAQRSYYSQSKYFSEMEVWRGIAEGLNATIVNPSVILGAGVWGESSTTFFKQVWAGLSYYAPGGTGFVDVRDVVNIMLHLVEHKCWGEQYIVNAENANYQTLLTYIAESMNKSVPVKLLSPWLASIAWRIDAALSFFFCKGPSFTKENKRTCFSTSKYSNNKVAELLGYQFIPLRQSVREAGQFFLQEQNR